MTKNDLLRRALEVGFDYHDGRHSDRCEACRLYLEIDAALAAPDEQSPLPPSFILVAQCAGCGVQDRPDSRHTDTCPAYPGQKVRP